MDKPSPDSRPRLLEGWLLKRGPTIDHDWMCQWCVLLPDAIVCYEDKACKIQRYSVSLGPRTRGVSFNSASAPGDSIKHVRERPFGFTVDFDPAAGKRRRFFYFDAGSKATLEAWMTTVSVAVREQLQAATKRAQRAERTVAFADAEAPAGRVSGTSSLSSVAGLSMCRMKTDVLCSDWSSGSDDSSTRSEDESEIEPPVAIPTRRGGVSAEAVGAFNVRLAAWTSPYSEKSDEHRACLAASLQAFPFLQGFESEVLQNIVDAVEVEQFQPGQVIYKQGEVGRSGYVLISGTATASTGNTQGLGQSMDRRSSRQNSKIDVGSFFGEHTMLWGFRRTDTVHAVTECLVGKLKRNAFFDIATRSSRAVRAVRESYLRKMSMFETFNDELIATVADIIKARTFRPGQAICEQGAKGREFFIVLSGECVATVQVETVGSDSDALDVHEVRRYKAGERFGELAFLNNTRRAATISAVTDVKVLYLDRPTFERVLGPLGLRQDQHYASDPRKAIADFYLPGNASGPRGVTKGSCPSQDSVRTEWFAVYRPVSRDALAKILDQSAVGKGLNVKGKSAKKNRLSGLVPFLQISDNNHKGKLEKSPPDARLKIFYQTADARNCAFVELEAICLSLQVADNASMPAISNDDTFLGVFGLEVPELAVCEAYIMRPDISFRVGWDTGRPSEPALMDMNLCAARCKTVPQVVLLQHDASDPMNPHGLVIAYAELGKVKPVVSDFDTFTVGSRHMKYERMPSEQLDYMAFLVEKTREILSTPGPKPWMSRWLEVMQRAREDGLHMRVPEYGFGDPMSYRLTKAVIDATQLSGAIRHGAECFNYYFPQELDSEYLVVWDGFDGKPWSYVKSDGLHGFLLDRIADGYSFPVNPVWALREQKWYDIFVALKNSKSASESFACWYPPDSAIVEEIEAIHKEFPHGFQVLSQPVREVEQVSP